MEQLAVEDYLSKGWQLSEFSNWISHKEKKNFLTVLGSKNLILLEEMDAKNKWKARMLISPEGMSILTLYFMPVSGTG